MKRVLALVLAIVMSLSICVNAFAETAEVLAGGFDNVDFGDSFYGFCIDRGLFGAVKGEIYTIVDADGNVSNNTSGDTDVANYIKVFFVE